MDFKQIKELIALVNDSNIGELKIEEKDFKISIRHQLYQPKVAVTTAVPALPAAAPEAAPIADNGAPEAEAKSGEAEETENTDHLITVRSPMIGTFYRSSSPDKPPYVKVGDHVNKEDVLCIIEAMKLFNEIESEVSGKIVKVMIENESPVEYDQPLFLIDPNA